MMIIISIIVCNCTTALNIDAYRKAGLDSMGSTDKWEDTDFIGYSNSSIFAASYYSREKVYICLKMTDKSDIMKIMMNGAELSYTYNEVKNTIILKRKDLSELDGYDFKPERVKEPNSGEGISIEFEVFSTQGGGDKGIDVFYKQQGGIGTLDLTMDMDNPEEMKLMKMDLIIRGMKELRPKQNMNMEQTGPPGDQNQGGHRPPPSDKENMNRNDSMDQDSEYSININFKKQSEK